MMINKEKIIQSAMTTFLVLTTNQYVCAATVEEPPTEKCYGVAKAGMNDCATATASCAGSATKDKQADAFLFVPKGICEKLVGGNLNPKPEKKSTS